MIDLTPIANSLIALLAAVVSVFLSPWLRRNTTAADREEILGWVELAVQAAEQLYQGAGRGEEKKQYVLDFLEEKGYQLDSAALDVAIESAVLSLKQAVAA